MSHPITRRAFLSALPTAAAIAATLPALAAAPLASAPEVGEIAVMYGQLTMHQRGAAQAALRKDGLFDLADAFEAQFPSAVQWSGDARYALLKGKRRPVYWIIRAPEHDDGERWFKLSTGFTGLLEPKGWFCRESELPKIAYRLDEYVMQRQRG